MNIIEPEHPNLRLLLHSAEDGVILNRVRFTAYHRHHYCEIHIIVSGEACFAMEDREWTAKESHAILIPAGRYHAVSMHGENPERIVFYADCDEGTEICKPIAHDLIQEIRSRVIGSGDVRNVYNHLFFILNELSQTRGYRLTHLKDDTIRIMEFFAHNYSRDIGLADLARELHLSEMQTQRVTKKCTGMTFGQNLLTQRMTVAENLMHHTEMSMQEISEYVGYRSYCGFWKAYRKYRDAKNAKKN